MQSCCPELIGAGLTLDGTANRQDDLGPETNTALAPGYPLRTSSGKIFGDAEMKSAQRPEDVSRASHAGLRALFLDVDALVVRRHVVKQIRTDQCPATAREAGAAAASAAGGPCPPASVCDVTPVNLCSDQNLKPLRHAGGTAVRWGRSLVDEDTDDDGGSTATAAAAADRHQQHSRRLDDGSGVGGVDIDVSGSGCGMPTLPAGVEALPPGRRQTMSGFDAAMSAVSRSADMILDGSESPPAVSLSSSSASGESVPPAASSRPRWTCRCTVRPGARRLLMSVQPYYMLYAFSSSAAAGQGGEDSDGEGGSWLDEALDLLDPMRRFLVRRLPLAEGSTQGTPAAQPPQRSPPSQQVLRAPLSLSLGGALLSSAVAAAAGATDVARAIIVTAVPRASYGVLSDNVIQIAPYDRTMMPYDDVLDHVAAILVRHLAAPQHGEDVSARLVLRSLGLWPDPLQASYAIAAKNRTACTAAKPQACKSSSDQGAVAGAPRVVSAGDGGDGVSVPRSGTARRRARVRVGSPPQCRAWLAAIPEDWEGEKQQQQQQQEQLLQEQDESSTARCRRRSVGVVTLRQLVLLPQALPPPTPPPPQQQPRLRVNMQRECTAGAQDVGPAAEIRASPFASAATAACARLPTVSVTALARSVHHVGGGAATDSEGALTQGSRAYLDADPYTSEGSDEQQQGYVSSGHELAEASLELVGEGPKSGGSCGSTGSSCSGSGGGGRCSQSATATKPRPLRSFSFPMRAALRLLANRSMSAPSAVPAPFPGADADAEAGVDADSGASTDGSGESPAAVKVEPRHRRHVPLPSRVSSAVVHALSAATSRVRHYFHHLGPHERKPVRCEAAAAGAVSESLVQMSAATATVAPGAARSPRACSASTAAAATAAATAAAAVPDMNEAAVSTVAATVPTQEPTLAPAESSVPFVAGVDIDVDVVAGVDAAGGYSLSSVHPCQLLLGAAGMSATRGGATRHDFRLASEALVLAGELYDLLLQSSAASSVASSAAVMAKTGAAAAAAAVAGRGAALQSLFRRAMAAARAVSYKPLRDVMQEVVWRHADPTRGSQEEVMLWLLWEISEVAKRQGAVIV